ncbi:MAG: T9SS type A sorting domain-containing protein [Saprospiraceae bacterium]|nr:T9SS type A sorting domain-containing protein [Saprospiraceae bacterium]
MIKTILIAICLQGLTVQLIAQALEGAPLPDTIFRIGHNLATKTNDYFDIVFKYDQSQLVTKTTFNKTNPDEPVVTENLNYTFTETGKPRSIHNTLINLYDIYYYTFDGKDSIFYRGVPDPETGLPPVSLTNEYNEFRQLTQSIRYSSPNYIISNTYTYNDAGLVKEQLFYTLINGNFSPPVKTTFEYNSANKLISAKDSVYNSFGFLDFQSHRIYNYPNQDTAFYSTLSLDKDGELISTIERHQTAVLDSTMIKYADGRIQNQLVKKYNSRAQLIEEITFKNSGEPFTKYLYEYNEDGSISVMYGYITDFFTNDLTLFLEDYYIYKSISSNSTELYHDLDALVYPNPASDILTVKSRSKINDVSIVSLSGQEIAKIDVNDDQAQINIASYMAGLYFAVIRIDGRKSCIPFLVHH